MGSQVVTPSRRMPWHIMASIIMPSITRVALPSVLFLPKESRVFFEIFRHNGFKLLSRAVILLFQKKAVKAATAATK